MEESRRETYLSNLAVLAELTQQQDSIEVLENSGGDASSSQNLQGLMLQKQTTSSNESYLSKKVRDLTKSLQTIAESCQLATMPVEEEKKEGQEE